MAIRRIDGWHIFEGVTPLRLCKVVNQPWIVSYLLVNWRKKKLSDVYLSFGSDFKQST